MTAPLHLKPKSALTLKRPGVASGGQALDEFSLLAVTDSVSGASERIVLNYGDRFGRAWTGEPGYFQVALDRGGQRLVIDLAQVTKTGVDPAQLKKALEKSRFVASSDMTMDPEDRTTNLTLNLKSPVQLRLSSETGARSQVIMELKAP